MMPARIPIAPRTARARTQNRLIIAGRAAARLTRPHFRPTHEREGRSKGPRVCISIVMLKFLHGLSAERCPHGAALSTVTASKHLKTLQSALDRFRHVADEGGHPLPPA